MTNHEFNVASEQVRKLCDGMSWKQVQDMMELLRCDAIDRERVKDGAPT